MVYVTLKYCHIFGPFIQRPLLTSVYFASFIVKKKPTEPMQKMITVTHNPAEASSNLPYSHLEHSCSSADPDDLETRSVGSDLVLADMSDSDLLLDDLDGYGITSRNFPKVSI